MNPRRTSSLAVVLTTSHVLSCMGLRSARLPDPPGSPAGLAIGSGGAVQAVSNVFLESRAAGGEIGYAVFGNHRADSTLMAYFGVILSKELGIPYHLVKWDDVNKACHVPEANKSAEPICEAFNHYEDMNLRLMIHILKKCPRMRAVRVNRRPSKTVASEYVYYLGQPPSKDRDCDQEYTQKLRHMPMRDGLNEVCKNYLKYYEPQMLAVHQYLMTDSGYTQGKKKNLLEVEFDDLRDKYGPTTRRIFAHWVGWGSPILCKLMCESSYWNVGKFPTHALGDNLVGCKKKKAEVFFEMEKEVNRLSGHHCIKRLKSLDEEVYGRLESSGGWRHHGLDPPEGFAENQ